MSEQQDVGAIRRIYRLTNDGDLPSVLNLLSDDAELFIFGSSKVPWAVSLARAEGCRAIPDGDG